MAEPPSVAGAVNETVAVVAPVATAVPIVGASDTVWMVDADARGVDASLGPVVLVAVTSTKNAVPGGSPPMMQDVAPIVEQDPLAKVASREAQAVAV